MMMGIVEHEIAGQGNSKPCRFLTYDISPPEKTWKFDWL